MGQIASDAGRKLRALVILLLAAWILFKFVLAAVATVAWVLIAVLAVAAVVWALRVL
jgi:hypothetical protein